MDFTRTAVIGCPGSGKTEFTEAFAKMLGREAEHLDKLLLRENWETLPYDERKVIHDGLISRGEWIIDGMWRSHLADRFSRATAVIFLDYPRRICVYRAMKRFLKWKGKQRSDIADGCIEKWDPYFAKYIWSFKKKMRPQILSLMKEYEGIKTLLTFVSPAETASFLKNFRFAK